LSHIKLDPRTAFRVHDVNVEACGADAYGEPDYGAQHSKNVGSVAHGTALPQVVALSQPSGKDGMSLEKLPTIDFPLRICGTALTEETFSVIGPWRCVMPPWREFWIYSPKRTAAGLA
jgi:hypothetical protein